MKSYNGFTPSQRRAGDRIIKDAISSGKLAPLSECSCAFCGQSKGILHYHAEDYTPDRILNDVVPLCWRCHMMVHRRFSHPRSFAAYMEDVQGGIVFPPVYRGNDWDALDIHMID